MDGPLKHIRGAALAAALLPLASIAATPASAQTLCPSGGVCGTVFIDTNNDGKMDNGEQGLGGVEVLVTDGTDTVPVYTNPDGTFALFENGGDIVTVSVVIPTGMQPSILGTDNVGKIDLQGLDSYTFPVGPITNFGLFTTPKTQPGTGTPGYWKNHPEAWPVTTITVGGIPYSRDTAIAWMNKPGKDKTQTMFASLVPAMLNILVGNDGSCVKNTIDAANAWMLAYGPVGNNVAGGSYAWSLGNPLQITLDNYNNGLLCAPHRQ